MESCIQFKNSVIPLDHVIFIPKSAPRYLNSFLLLLTLHSTCLYVKLCKAPYFHFLMREKLSVREITYVNQAACLLLSSRMIIQSINRGIHWGRGTWMWVSRSPRPSTDHSASTSPKCTVHGWHYSNKDNTIKYKLQHVVIVSTPPTANPGLSLNPNLDNLCAAHWAVHPPFQAGRWKDTWGR